MVDRDPKTQEMKPKILVAGLSRGTQIRFYTFKLSFENGYVIPMS